MQRRRRGGPWRRRSSHSQRSHIIRRVKRVIAVTVIAAGITGASTAGVASAETNTGKGSTGPTKQQVCEALPVIVNTLAAIGGAMDLGSPAQRVIQAAQQAIYDSASKACPA
jgi:hypothetical protein